MIRRPHSPTLNIFFYVDSVPFTADVIEGKTSLGGSESACLGLARALAKRGHDVHLYATKLHPDAVGEHAGVLWNRAEELVDTLRCVEPDVFCSLRMTEPFAARMMAKWVQLWNEDLLIIPANTEGALAQVDELVYVSRFQQAQWEARGPFTSRLPSWIITNGVDAHLFPVNTWRVGDPPVFLHTSRPERGYDALFTLWPKVRAAYPEAELRVCRYSSMYDAMGWGKVVEAYDQRMMTMQANVGGVTFLGELTKRQLYTHLSQAAALLYPISQPGFAETNCLAVTEAQGCGAPVIATYSGALPETLHPDAGLLIEGDPLTEDVQSVFLAAIDKVLANPMWRRRAQVAGIAHARLADFATLAVQWEDHWWARFEERYAAERPKILRRLLHWDNHQAAKVVAQDIITDPVTDPSRLVTKTEYTEASDALALCARVIRQEESTEADYGEYALDTKLEVEHSIRFKHVSDILNARFHGQPTPLTILDVACGNGAMAVRLALMFPKATITAIDYSAEVLARARTGVATNYPDLASRITFIQCGWQDVTRGAGYDAVVCFPAGTPIAGSSQLIEAQRVGDRVKGSGGKDQTVSKVFQRTYSGPMVRLGVACVPDTDMTANHRVLVSSVRRVHRKVTKPGQKAVFEWVATPSVWKEASELTLNDWVSIPRLAGDKPPVLCFPDGIDHAIDEDLAWLLGLYVAEGSRRNKTSAVLSLSSDETEIAERAARIFRANGVRATISRSPSVLALHLMRVRIPGAAWADLLAQYCGKGALNKRVPEAIRHAPEPIVRAFIAGLVEGDGCLRRGGRTHAAYWSISTISKPLAYGVLELLHRIGMHGSISVEPRDVGIICDRVVFQRDRYTIFWSARAWDGDLDSAGRIPYGNGQFIGNRVYLQVRSVSRYEAVDLPVFNLQTTDHTYGVPFTVHNCGEFLEHVEHPHVLIDRLESLLVEGGCIVYTCPAGPYVELLEHGVPRRRGHVHTFSARDIVTLFSGKHQAEWIYQHGGRSPRGNSVGYWLVSHFRGAGKQPPAGILDYHRQVLIERPAVRLVAAMIVRDGADWILPCLKSLYQVVDGVVILDTGSTDGSQTLARSQDALVYEEPWPGSFSVARNRSIALAQPLNPDWILWVDADEVLDKGYFLWNFVTSCGSFDGVALRQIHMHMDQAPYWDKPVRLFRANKGIQFYGYVHEQPASTAANIDAGVDGVIYTELASLLHYGYRTLDLRNEKMLVRNLPLLDKELRDPVNRRRLTYVLVMRDHVHLADQARDQGQIQIAVKRLQLAVEYWDRHFADPNDQYHEMAWEYYQNALDRLEQLGFLRPVRVQWAFTASLTTADVAPKLVKFLARTPAEAGTLMAGRTTKWLAQLNQGHLPAIRTAPAEDVRVTPYTSRQEPDPCSLSATS